MSNKETSEDFGYELSDVNVKILLISGVFMVVATAFSFVFCFGIAKSLSQGGWDTISDFEKSQFAGEHNEWIEDTRLQAEPGLELEVHLKEQRRSVGDYSIVSDGHDQPEIIQIPIEVAIDLVVSQRVLPEFPVVEAKE